MDAPTAALIGAGVASTVGLVAQFVAHGLAIRRDRRNQRRQRLHDVIVVAATALYEPLDRPVLDPNEPEPRPGTLAALDPVLREPSVRSFLDSTGQAITLLQIHFGHAHPLIDAYGDAFVAASDAVQAKARHFASDDEDARIENIPRLAEVLRAGQRARDEWMRQAREYVDSL